MQKTKKKYTIKHRIPGRVRLKIPAIRFSKERAEALIKTLSHETAVIQADSRPASGSLILLFDPQKIPTKSLLASVEECVDRLSLQPRPGAESKPQPPAAWIAGCAIRCQKPRKENPWWAGSWGWWPSPFLWVSPWSEG